MVTWGEPLERDDVAYSSELVEVVPGIRAAWDPINLLLLQALVGGPLYRPRPSPCGNPPSRAVPALIWGVARLKTTDTDLRRE